MKHIFLVVFIFLSLSGKAQPPHPAGTYTTHPELNEFIGTWRWTSGTDTVILVLKKQMIYYPPIMDYNEERLVGWHKYVKNGVVIESDLQSVGVQWLWGHVWESQASLFGAGNGLHKIYFTTFKDYTIHKKAEMRFEMLPGSTTQAKWELRNTRGLKPWNFNYDLTLPKDLILTKL